MLWVIKWEKNKGSLKEQKIFVQIKRNLPVDQLKRENISYYFIMEINWKVSLKEKE